MTFYLNIKNTHIDKLYLIYNYIDVYPTKAIKHQHE